MKNSSNGFRSKQVCGYVDKAIDDLLLAHLGPTVSHRAPLPGVVGNSDPVSISQTPKLHTILNSFQDVLLRGSFYISVEIPDLAGGIHQMVQNSHLWIFSTGILIGYGRLEDSYNLVVVVHFYLLALGVG